MILIARPRLLVIRGTYAKQRELDENKRGGAKTYGVKSLNTVWEYPSTRDLAKEIGLTRIFLFVHKL
jgi:hypothetical protein